MRTDLNGKQTVSTYWVDVRENQTLEGRGPQPVLAGCQVRWLRRAGRTTATRRAARTASLPASWWGSGETLATGDERPENFYVASEADKMVESRRAFAKIAAESSGSASSLASNSTRLDTTTRTFQAQFFTGSWRGELAAYSIAADGTLSSTPLWRASDLLVTSPGWPRRRERKRCNACRSTPRQATAPNGIGAVNSARIRTPPVATMLPTTMGKNQPHAARGPDSKLRYRPKRKNSPTEIKKKTCPTSVD